MRKLNILQVITGTDWSGGQQQVLLLLRGLKRRGHHILLACPPHSLLGEKAEKENIPVSYIPMRKEVDVYSLIQLARLMKRERIEVVNVHRPTAHTLAQVAAFLTKTPVFIVTRRVSFPPSGIISAKVKYQLGVSQIVAVSQGIREVLIRSGVQADKITTIYSGVELDLFKPDIPGTPIRQAYKIPLEAPLVGKVANYSYWKGHHIFLQAAQIVASQIPDVRFLLVGSNTDHPKLKDLGKTLGLNDQVIYAGFREDIPQILAALDISVNTPLRGEGLSGAIRESLAMEKSVVATDVAGNSEIVLHGKTGYLVPPNDPESLARAIIHLLKHKEEAARLGKAGRHWVEENFTSEKMVEKTEALYYELLEKAGNGSLLE